MAIALPYDEPVRLPSPRRLTLTPELLATETGAELERATRVLPVAEAIVLEYAPEAPEAIMNEAAIRLAGYLLQADYGTVREESLGPMSVGYQLNHAMAFRNSGSQALLTRFKKRRAGAI